MLNILIPVDGSANALGAIRHAMQLRRQTPDMLVHILNVQVPFSRHISRFVSGNTLRSFHQERSYRALESAEQLLTQARLPYVRHLGVGSQAPVITDLARTLDVDLILMGTARKNSLTRMIEDSVTHRVLELSTVPVEVIAGKAVSPVERYGVPSAVLASLGALWLVTAE